jgi:hypothetical protein
MPVQWNDLLDAYEFVNAEGNAGGRYGQGGDFAWICRATGEIIWAFNESSEDEDELDGWLDDLDDDEYESARQGISDDDNGDALPEDIDDLDKYLRVPSEAQLDLGPRVALDFAREFLPKDYDEVERIFRGRSRNRSASRMLANTKFAALLKRHKKPQRWPAYLAKATEDALREWCKDNAIKISEREGEPERPAPKAPKPKTTESKAAKSKKADRP